METLIVMYSEIVPTMYVMLIGILFVAAMGRIIYEKVKGKSIIAKPVGAFQELSNSVTGMSDDEETTTQKIDAVSGKELL